MEVDPSYSRAPWMVEADEGIRCLPDRALDRDVRVLTNVVRGSQKLGKTQQIFDYFAQGSQPLLRPHMRKIVTEWMMELTAQEKCHPEVLALAVNYMDRMLCRFQIHKNQFQLLASTCVFLASKFRENEPVTAEKLVVMTDFSISVDLILEWELLVLQVLNWDLSTVTPYTILNQLLTHKCLQTFQGPLEDLSPTIRLRAETLLALSCTENQFTTLPPTLVATGCFLAALSGVRSRLENGNAVLRVALESLAFVTGHSFQEMLGCASVLESMLLQKLTPEQQIQLQGPSVPRPGPSGPTGPNFSPSSTHQPELSRNNNSKTTSETTQQQHHFLGLASSIDTSPSTSSTPASSHTKMVDTSRSNSNTPTELMDVAAACVC